jgi:hypothetical protein
MNTENQRWERCIRSLKEFASLLKDFISIVILIFNFIMG